MSKGFKPPKRDVYRKFLYIDGDEVVNFLASVEGGIAEEVIERAIEEKEWTLGADIQKWVGLHVSRGSKRSLHREVRRKRTAHTAVAAFLDLLEKRDGIGILHRHCSEADWHVEENMVLKIEADLEVVSSYEAPQVDWEPSLWDRIRGSAPPTSVVHVAVADADRPREKQRLVLRVDGRYLLGDVQPDDLSRTATVVAQVATVLGDAEAYVLLQPASRPEIVPLQTVVTPSSTAREQRCLPTNEEPREVQTFPPEIQAVEAERQWRAPTILLRPICIFK